MDRTVFGSSRATPAFDRTLSVRLGGAVRAAALAALGVLVSSSSSDASPRAEMLGAPSCSEDCNNKASDCLDACEEKFKSDDKARVTCKFECAQTRQQCEKDCVK